MYERQIRDRCAQCCAPILLAAIALASSSCGGPARRPAGRGRLPFVVRVNDVVVPGEPAALSLQGSEEGMTGSAQIPPDYEELRRLTDVLADVLEASGIFTVVVTGEGPDVDADLEIDMTLSGDSFGSGQPKAGTMVFSTITWLFLGHLAWFIDDREYPDPDILMKVTVREGRQQRGEDAPGRALWVKDLDLKGLELSLSERYAKSDFFIGIVRPPYIGDSDLAHAGVSLSRRAVDDFAAQVLERLLGEFPASHHKELTCFLVHDPDAREVTVVSRQAVKVVHFEAADGRSDSYSGPTVGSYAIGPGSPRERVRRELSRRDLGIGASGEDRYYRFPVPVGMSGVLRIRTVLDKGSARWTIRQPGGGTPSPSKGGHDSTEL